MKHLIFLLLPLAGCNYTPKKTAPSENDIHWAARLLGRGEGVQMAAMYTRDIRLAKLLDSVKREGLRQLDSIQKTYK